MKYTKSETKQLEQMANSFHFDEPKKLDSLFIVISGMEGTGKTHLACSLSKKMPIYFIDTELRGNIVASKFKDNIYYKRATNFLQTQAIIYSIFTHYKEHKQEQKEAAVLIDSGTDLQQFAETRYKEIAKLEKVWPQYLWAQIWDMLDNLIYSIRKSGLTLIMTTRMKDEYISNEPSGKKIPRIYNRVPYNADIMLATHNNKIVMTKNGFSEIQNKEFQREPLNNIINKIINGE